MPSFGNVFGKDSRTFSPEIQPVWISVDESKLSGGTVDISGLKKGDLIPAALPVYLPKMGGTAQLIIGFSVKANVAATDTAVDFDWSKSYGFKLKKGDIVGKSMQQRVLPPRLLLSAIIPKVQALLSLQTTSAHLPQAIFSM